jgi:hypothetical protein
MQRPDWAPPEIDVDRPSVARVYDFLLGGTHNFAVDREYASQMLAAMPQAPLMARANRAFLGRAVRHLGGAGVRQFLDVGAGIPAAGAVHEIAGPGARVVYVDVDPVAVLHGRAILAGNPNADVVGADARDLDGILDSPQVKHLLDLSEPLGVLMLGLLYFIADADDPYGLVGRLRDRTAPGSHLVVSHFVEEQPEVGERIAEQTHRLPQVAVLRTHAEVVRFFDGWRLLDPGVVRLDRWRPDPDDVASDVPLNFVAGVAVKDGAAAVPGSPPATPPS